MLLSYRPIHFRFVDKRFEISNLELVRDMEEIKILLELH